MERENDRKRSGLHNFRDNRITDHRINFTTHRLVEVLNGDLAELLDTVGSYFQSEKLKDATAVSVRADVAGGSRLPCLTRPLMPTIFEHVAAARQALREAGIGAVEAELSARALLNTRSVGTPLAILVSANQLESSTFAEHYDSLVARRGRARAGRLHYWTTGILGSVARCVSGAYSSLDPKPSSLSKRALERFADRTRPLAVADACTGSGCLAVALAAELPHATVVATDISQGALGRRAAKQRTPPSGRSNPFHPHQRSRRRGRHIRPDCGQPAVRSDCRPPGAANQRLRDFETPVALFGGETGMDIVATLVGQAVGRLRHQGYLMFEFGFGQEVVVEELIEKTEGLTFIGLCRDLQGIAALRHREKNVDQLSAFRRYVQLPLLQDHQSRDPGLHSYEDARLAGLQRHQPTGTHASLSSCPSVTSPR